MEMFQEEKLDLDSPSLYRGVTYFYFIFYFKKDFSMAPPRPLFRTLTYPLYTQPVSSLAPSLQDHIHAAIERQDRTEIYSLLPQNPTLFEDFLKENVSKDPWGCFKLALLQPRPAQAIEFLCCFASEEDKKYNISPDKGFFTQKDSVSGQTLATIIITHHSLSSREKQEILEICYKQAPEHFPSPSTVAVYFKDWITFHH